MIFNLRSKLKNIFLVIFFTAGVLSAQTYLENQLNKAQLLFQNKKYFDAITEYKRLQFFDIEGKYSFEANVNIGLCYKAGAKFDDAINSFSTVLKHLSDPEKIFQVKVEIVKSNILRKTIPRALSLCDEIEKEYDSYSKREEINYWRGWAFMFNDDWENAAGCFSKNGNLELTKLCRSVQSEKVSITFAKVISYILPGAGQIYSGQILSGFMSLAWNVLAGYLTINAFVSERAFDGVVIGELLWLRFYRGNIQNAEKFAEEKNLDIANRALIYLQNEFKGIKP